MALETHCNIPQPRHLQNETKDPCESIFSFSAIPCHENSSEFVHYCDTRADRKQRLFCGRRGFDKNELHPNGRGIVRPLSRPPFCVGLCNHETLP